MVVISKYTSPPSQGIKLKMKMKKFLLLTFLLITNFSFGGNFSLVTRETTSYGFSGVLFSNPIYDNNNIQNTLLVQASGSTPYTRYGSINYYGAKVLNIASLRTQLANTGYGLSGCQLTIFGHSVNLQDTAISYNSANSYSGDSSINLYVYPGGYTGVITVQVLINLTGQYVYIAGQTDTVTLNIVCCTIAPQVSLNKSGSQSACYGDPVQLMAPSGYSYYQWGQYITDNINGTPTLVMDTLTTTTSRLLWVDTTSNYYVNCYTKGSCPVRSNTFSFTIKHAVPPNICVVSVDSTTGKNIVVWPSVYIADIKSYNIYKETSASAFALIGNTPVDSLSVFEDSASNPAVHSDSYEISAMDSCGNETPLSAFHKTVHLSVDQGQFGWNLSWEPYIGFTVLTYEIYRGASPDHLSLLTSVSSSISTYSDLNVPSGPIYYVIEAVNPNGGCTPGIGKTGTITYSRSNTFSSLDASIEKPIVNQPISIYPNPSGGVFNISGANKGITVYDQLGKEIINTQVATQTLEIKNVGIYVVRIKTDSELYDDKVIVQ